VWLCEHMARLDPGEQEILRQAAPILERLATER